LKFPDVEVALWDSCSESIGNIAQAGSGHDATSVLGLRITHGLSCKGQTELGRSVFLDCQESCRTWLEGKELLIMVCAPGGGFLAGLLQNLQRLASSLDIKCLSFVLTPFAFEGQRRGESAKTAIRRLREVCLGVPVIECDDYSGWLDEEGCALAAIAKARGLLACSIQYGGASERRGYLRV
jgi:cell division protein FtsZ